MTPANRLAAIFLAHAKVRFDPQPEPAQLEHLLAEAWESAHEQWPGVALSDALFIQHLAERLPKPTPPLSVEASLGQMSLAELYLACACLHGTPTATECFERQYLAKLPEQLKSLKLGNAMVDDVRQMARVKFLVSSPEGPPKLAEYTGRGALMNWVRVTAVRIATKLMATEKPAPDDMEAVVQALPAPGVDAELDVIKRRYQAEFRSAVREAFSALSDDERQLLRLYFVDQLSTYELGTLFRVNQATISRWLKAARLTVYEDTRRRLQARLGLTARDFTSFLALLDSQLDLSISQLLGEEDALPPKPSQG